MKNQRLQKFVSKRRFDLGMTQAELARRVGVAPSTICHVEKGAVTKFPQTKVRKLANVLSVDPEKLTKMWIKAILVPLRQELMRKIAAGE